MPGGRRRLLVPAVAGLLVMVIAGPVLGHSALVSSDPADKAVLAVPPTTITLTFSEALDAGRSSFKLMGPGGTIGTGQVAGDPKAMTLGGLALAPGAYEIQWTSAALDGDILRGTLTFAVSAASSIAPTAAPSIAPTAAAASPAPSAGPTPTPSGDDVLLPIVAALLLVVVVGFSLLRRSRRA